MAGVGVRTMMRDWSSGTPFFPRAVEIEVRILATSTSVPEPDTTTLILMVVPSEPAASAGGRTAGHTPNVSGTKQNEEAKRGRRVAHCRNRQSV
jgi:hypothetical protein